MHCPPGLGQEPQLPSPTGPHRCWCRGYGASPCQVHVVRTKLQGWHLVLLRLSPAAAAPNKWCLAATAQHIACAQPQL